MAVPFQYPSENVSNIIDFINYANYLTNGVMGIVFLIIIAVISFVVSKGFSNEKAFGFSGFLTLITAILFRFMGLINDAVMYIVVVVVVAVIVLMWNTRKQEEV